MAAMIRFLRHYLRPRDGRVASAETTYSRDGGRLDATVYRPAGAGVEPLPGWVLLHGLTYLGRAHPSLERFAASIAASGTVVIVPDVPEWRDLRVAPQVTGRTIAGALDRVAELPRVDPARLGVIGFSFGATQALAAAADPDVAGRLRGMAAWGGYFDLDNLFRFGITGEYHDLDDTPYRLDPDPYGRWIMIGNYLTGVPGHEDDGDVAEAVFRLAVASGRRRVYASDPIYDPLKIRERAELPPAKRELFDLIAPVTGAPAPDRDLAHDFALRLADAARRAEPMLDPIDRLPDVKVRTLLAHGRDDRLVPFTESLRLDRALPRDGCAGCTITSLFAHSGGTDRRLGPIGLAAETARFVRLLDGILSLV